MNEADGFREGLNPSYDQVCLTGKSVNPVQPHLQK
ncbi:MAG: hypothetical protein QOE49_635, partial [Rhodospirillaceae bacterium]|nr:hypothetical protein [Rhodospirillaceae bacterium]